MALDVNALAALVERFEKPRWSPEAICHRAQLALVRDPASTVCGCAGRRSGKSFSACVKGTDVCLATPNVSAVYIAATRASAKRMVWKPLLALNKEFALGGVPNLNDLTLTFPNGSTFYVIAVDSEAAADKVRGIQNMHWVCVDEAQRYKAATLSYLLRDVLRAGQLDALDAAQMWLLGTPNPLGKHGAFWDRWNAPTTSRHKFTIYDNTKLGTVEAIEVAIAGILTEENETREGAWFKTEILAEWGAVDLDRRVYKFDDDANTFDVLPELTRFVVAGDIGWSDADAVAVLGWSDDDPTVYLVEEHIATKQTDNDLDDLLMGLYAAFDPLAIVLDAGGGGKKTVETLRQLHPNVPIEAAVKPPVNIQIKILNGLLKLGHFKVRADSRFSKDVREVGWLNGVVNGKLDESGHSDIIPACRYGAIKAIPYLPSYDTRTDEVRKAEAAAEARRLRLKRAERVARQLRGQRADFDEDDASPWSAPTADDFDTFEDE